MKKHYILILLISIKVFGFSQIEQKIKIESNGDLKSVVFKSKIISMDINKNYVTFSEDSEYCAIFTLYKDQNIGWFDIYSSSGKKINTSEIIAQKIFLSNDGRFVAYNPTYSESLFLIKSTLDFYDSDGKKIKNDLNFNLIRGVSFFDSGLLFVLHDESNLGSINNNLFEAIVLNKQYDLVVRKQAFHYESDSFIAPKLDYQDSSIIIPIKSQTNKIKKYDFKLNFISETIKQN